MRCKQMLSLSVVTVLLAASLAGCGTSSTAAAKAAAQGTPYSKSEVYKQMLAMQNN